MSDYGSPGAGAGAGGKKDAFADAVQRARQVRSEQGSSETGALNQASLLCALATMLG